MPLQGFLWLFVAGLLACAVTVSSLVKADDDIKLTLVGKKIPHYFDDPIDSPFANAVTLIGEETGLDISIVLYPPKRALAMFREGKGDILLPHPVHRDGRRDISMLPRKHLFSLPLASVSRHILTTGLKPVVRGYGDLTNMKVAGVLGYIYEQDIARHGIRLIKATDQMSLIRMLHAGRVDAILSFPFEASLVARRLALDIQFKFDSNFVISQSDLVFVMQDSAAGRRALPLIDAAIERLRKSGRLGDILDFSLQD